MLRIIPTSLVVSVQLKQPTRTPERNPRRRTVTVTKESDLQPVSQSHTPRAKPKTGKKGGDRGERVNYIRSVKAQRDVSSQRVRFQPDTEPISPQAAHFVEASGTALQLRMEPKYPQ